MYPNHRAGHCAPIILPTFAMVALLSACGDPTGSKERLTLVAPDANVATYEVATAVVRGATLAEPSYAGTLGPEAVTAARVNDSTIAMVIPPVPAGAHQLRIDIGNAVAEAMLTVTATPQVAAPTTFVDGVTTMLAADVTAMREALAAVSASHIAIDEAAFLRDATMAEASLDSARAEFAAMTPDEQQEAANILSVLIADDAEGAGFARMAQASAALPEFCDEIRLNLTGEQIEECERAAVNELPMLNDRAVRCEAEAITAARTGFRTRVRKMLTHLVNGCHYARLSYWSATTWEAITWPVIPKFDPFGAFDSDLRANGSPALRSTAEDRLVFTWGVARTVAPTIRFRSIIASDVGRVSAATQTDQLLDGLAENWHELNTHTDGSLGQAPATLDRVTTAPLEVRNWSASRLRVGAVVAPRQIDGLWKQVSGGIELQFDASDRSSDIPFTFDVIYDGGVYGADTLRIPAILTMDSTAVYAAAALGRWTVTGNGTTYDLELRPEGKGAYIVAMPPEGYCRGPVYGDYGEVDGHCEYNIQWGVRLVEGRYYLYESGFWTGGSGDDSDPLTMPLTGFTTYFQGAPYMRYVKNP
jgi:hypothetical protein